MIYKKMEYKLDRIVFTKAGPLGEEENGESLGSIIHRKMLEQEFSEKKCFWWGYGATSAKPETVQEFARKNEDNGFTTYLVMALVKNHGYFNFRNIMEASKSLAGAWEWRAEKYREKDNENADVLTVPIGINTGSDERYQFIGKELKEVDIEIDMWHYTYKTDEGEEKPLVNCDKGSLTTACAKKVTNPPNKKHPIKIRFIAEFVEPYAVYTRW